MDPLGNAIRDFLKQTHATSVRNAVSLAMEFQDEGMKHDQIEEMLYSSGFDVDIVAEALDSIPAAAKKRKK